ncbi:V-type ATPase 116kDa subunit family protein [Entomospira entomophila]|uniref:V-type ATP synthase subunit I n=1 Tax=Entomospira entomophila TaxID=2719988 RepID=A0A968G7C0_9SPIO|nr:V-type ATPase 116kDa subunit family protein [Entomospira entomophilus]NIZ39950.1 hypothetical protein [Entomospira entomophilus]WDI35511.1 V-type ATPase 116kDa subunit family protein [Entomospira entomophilus]
MIANMSRISLIVSRSEREDALNKLAETNLFHVGSLDNYNDSIAELHRHLTHAELMLRYIPEKSEVPEATTSDVQSILMEIESTYAKRIELEKLIQDYDRLLNSYGAWGDFSVENLQYLETEGHIIRLYKVDAKTYKKLKNEATIPLYLCTVHKGTHYIAMYSVEEDKFPSIPAEEIPSLSPAEMRSTIKQSHKELLELRLKLNQLAGYRTQIQEYANNLQETIAFERTSDAFQHEEELSILQGYIPTEDITNFREYAKKHGWAFYTKDALTGDENADSEIPTKIKPSFWGKFVQPMLDSFGFVPGYQEVDISGVMFFFFAIFFAMIIGDAGYGSIFLLLSLGMMFKLKSAGKAISPFIPYVSIMSLATMAWGILTDNWFGTQLAPHVSVLQPLKSEFLADDSGVQFLSFMLGFTHLVIAHVWSFARRLKYNPKSALVDVGQLMMLSALLFLIMNMIIGPDTLLGPRPDWIAPVIIAGVVLVLLFGEQQPLVNIFKGFGNGLQFDKVLATLLGAIGNFGDVLSYIRLYAVGLAGFSIASSFNNLTSGLPIWIAAIILLLAHTLNIMLSLLSVVVHALRLNSLEFSTHVGLSWAGNAYKPFTSKKVIQFADSKK